jgi:hypothetical protein
MPPNRQSCVLHLLETGASTASRAYSNLKESAEDRNGSVVLANLASAAVSTFRTGRSKSRMSTANVRTGNPCANTSYTSA